MRGALRAAAVAAALAAGGRASAQEAAPRHAVRALVTAPVGEFAEYSGLGWGGEYVYLHPLGRRGALHARAAAGVLQFRPVEDAVCDPGCSSPARVTTRRTGGYATAGPQVTARLGPVRLHAYTAAGLALLESATRDSGTGATFRGAGIGWEAGGGFSVPLRRDLALEVGAGCRGGSRARYAPRGGPGANGTRVSPSPRPWNSVTTGVGIQLNPGG